MSTVPSLPTKLKVFLCYERDNRLLVEYLARHLDSAVDLIVDDKDWAAGERLDVNQSSSVGDADYMLAFLSPTYRESDEVGKELKLAAKRCKELGREFVVPVLINGLRSTQLPAQLKRDKTIWLSCESEKDKFLLDAKSQEIMAHFLRIVGRHFRAAGEGGKTKSRFAGVDFESLRNFYVTCREADEGVFFNSTVSMDEWFQPNLQIHLAVQDGMVHGRRLEDIRSLAKRPNSVDPQGTKCTGLERPQFSRVVFLPITTGELEGLIKNRGDDFSKQFRAFVQIHNLMGCPLAVVPVDLFVTEIIPADINFFRDQANTKILGLPPELGKLAAERKRGWEKQSAEILVNKLFTQLETPLGQFQPCVDFGLFSPQKPNGGVDDFVWFGAIDKNGEVTYANHPRNLKDVDASLIRGREKPILSKYLNFGRLVKRVVFSTAEQPRDLAPKETKYIEKFLELNPYAFSFEGQDGTLVKSILTVKEQFCPWRFISHALPTSAKEAVC